MKRTLLSLAMVCLVGFSASSASAYDIFMQISNLTGESLDANHKGWIDINSFSHGMSKTAGTPPNHADISITKRLDKSSTPLDLNVNKGTIFPKVTVEFQKSTSETPVVFYRVILDNAIVTSVSSSGSSGGDTVTENISVKYDKISWVYYQIDQFGKVGGAVSNFWDVAVGKGG